MSMLGNLAESLDLLKQFSEGEINEGTLHAAIDAMKVCIRDINTYLPSTIASTQSLVRDALSHLMLYRSEIIRRATAARKIIWKRHEVNRLAGQTEKENEYLRRIIQSEESLQQALAILPEQSDQTRLILEQLIRDLNQ
jgi:hypothetical protein